MPILQIGKLKLQRDEVTSPIVGDLGDEVCVIPKL